MLLFASSAFVSPDMVQRCACHFGLPWPWRVHLTDIASHHSAAGSLESAEVVARAERLGRLRVLYRGKFAEEAREQIHSALSVTTTDHHSFAHLSALLDGSSISVTVVAAPNFEKRYNVSRAR